MPLNWLIEAYKWQLLTAKYKRISIKESLKSIMTGLAIGLWTPNRLGEIPGRALIFEKQYRYKAIGSATIGSFSQFFVTLFAGIAGLLLFNKLVNDAIRINLTLIIIFFVAIIFMALFFIFFNKISAFAIRKSILTKFFEKLTIGEKIKIKDLVTLISLSFLRYVIFSLQLYLLFKFAGIKISLLNSLIATSASYLLLSLSPNIIIADIGIRGSAMIFFVSFFSQKIDSIFFASILIWLINIVVPAIYGQYQLLKHNKQRFEIKFDKNQDLLLKKE